ncbi:transposase [Desulfobacterales bacterium HSG2]|nr:transposase [Desulfobacterales bacterium HSG2]
MPVTIQSQFTSAVVEANLDVFTRSYTEGENTIIEFDMRKRDYQKEAGINYDICWPEKTYNVDIHEFSTFQNPIVCRFISGQAWYYDDQNRQIWFTPKLREVSARQHVSRSVLACFLAVVCGVSLRNIATIFAVLFRIPVSKSSVKRWIDTVGSSLPSEDEILRQLTELKEPDQCHIDGYYPMRTDNCVMVIKDESDRILITHEAASENGDDARQFLQKVKDCGMTVSLAFSDYSDSYVKAVREVFPDAKFQADHFHTAKNIWKHLKKCLLEYRRKLKAEGEENQDGDMLEIASELWKFRRMEKNHDGIRSAKTRKHYIKIYQTIKYLSADVAEFINSGTEQNTS